jgi:hypothetical protein
MANHTRKKNSGTLIASTSNSAVGATKGVAWFSCRRRYFQKKAMAVRPTAKLETIVTVITK